ncbi:MAG: UDP-3-O-(3-hydroxymyristoyl)glucosamine N-acyltransferase [Pseudomonadota bacterium]
MTRSAPQPLLLGEIAKATGAELDGDANLEITGIASLDAAGAGDLSHLSNAAYREQLSSCQASAVILAPGERDRWSGAALVHPNPYLTYARASQLFRSERQPAAGIDPAASVAADAVVAATAVIGPGVVIGARAQIADGAVVGANTVIADDCAVGAHSTLHANVTLAGPVTLGRECVIYSGAVIGAEGFGFTPDERGQWTPIAQLGGVVIGDRVSVGANTCIDRGALGDTHIEDGVKIDNLCQIGHNCRIGAHTLICGCVGIVGSTRIGRHCVLAGGAGIGGDRPIELCDQVIVSARTLVVQSISEPGTYSGGTLHAPMLSWKRNALRFQELDGMMRRIRRLEKLVAAAGNSAEG